jgi:hypothetical protein
MGRIPGARCALTGVTGRKRHTKLSAERDRSGAHLAASVQVKTF